MVKKTKLALLHDENEKLKALNKIKDRLITSLVAFNIANKIELPKDVIYVIENLYKIKWSDFKNGHHKSGKTTEAKEIPEIKIEIKK